MVYFVAFAWYTGSSINILANKGLFLWI